MSKRNKIIYWIATAWLSLGMVSTAIVQLLRVPEEVDKITELGYPTYLLTILGVWKILGVTVVLMPGARLLKEWAYAGFFFAMSGATLSRIASGNTMVEIAPSMLLLILTLVSWYFRPAARKLIPVHPINE
jgi:hypothetical protein